MGIGSLFVVSDPSTTLLACTRCLISTVQPSTRVIHQSLFFIYRLRVAKEYDLSASLTVSEWKIQHFLEIALSLSLKVRLSPLSCLVSELKLSIAVERKILPAIALPDDFTHYKLDFVDIMRMEVAFSQALSFKLLATDHEWNDWELELERIRSYLKHCPRSTEELLGQLLGPSLEPASETPEGSPLNAPGSA